MNLSGRDLEFIDNYFNIWFIIDNSLLREEYIDRIKETWGENLHIQYLILTKK